MLRYKELISETLINPFDHPYVIINKEMEILGHHGVEDSPVFSLKLEEGMSLTEILHPEIRATVVDALEDAIRGSKQSGTFKELSGDYLTRVQVVAAPFEVHDNRYICFFETIFSKELSTSSDNGDGQQSESIFAKAFHTAPLPLAILRMDDCTMLNVNDALVKISGFAKDQLQGASALKLGFFQSDRDIVRINQLLKERNSVHNYPVSFTLKNGHDIKTILNLDLVEFNGEQCLLAIIQDITEIKRTQAKLKANEHLLISINENLNEGIYRSTPEDGFVYINKAFARMFGLSLEEAMVINPERLYANEDDRSRIKKQLATDGFLKNEQIEFRRSNGEIFWGYLSTLLTSDENGNLIYDGAIVDISDIKRSKVLLHERNSELKKINAELDRFVYSASHDLRAPLTSLLGLVNIALLETNNEKVVSYLEMMKGSVNKLDSLISDIINVSRNARQGLHAESVDFKELAEETIEHLKYLPSADSIRTEIHVSDGQEFRSDPKRLRILFNNLISNAFRYHDPHKADPYLKMYVEIKDGRAHITIADNGKGIDPDHIESIFEMFFRATTEAEGSGLGLYIVKETVEKLHGIIEVESKLGEGSTFKLSLPNLR
ncbi:MAG: PAS domain-containing sensor histidine kinase [Cyclobacteriaceae bacterium]|nr:PAS domain-containing sensor histidine kinase [Cyclobacteriaceae bacterium]